MAVSLFVYGTLMSPQVVRVLLGRVPSMVEPAVVSGYCRYPVRDRVYPGLIPSSASETTGVLLEGLEHHELEVLDWFESDDYEKKFVEARVTDGQRKVQAYIWSRPPPETLDLEKEWDFSGFCETQLDWYLTSTVRPCRQEMDELGIGRRRK